MASRVAVRSAGRGERAAADRMASRCPLRGMGGRARPARASADVQAGRPGANEAPVPGSGVNVFRESHQKETPLPPVSFMNTQVAARMMTAWMSASAATVGDGSSSEKM